MKLIDILLQYLPKHGGWPEGAKICAQDYDNEICFYSNPGIHRTGNGCIWTIPCGVDSRIVKRGIALPPAEDEENSVISREEYEDAYALSQRKVWDGKGLPPVGAVCELTIFASEDFPHRIGESGELVTILGRGKFNEKDVAFYEVDLGTQKVIACGVAECFRPIQTQEEKERDAAILALQNAFRAIPHSDCIGEGLYEEIAAGKIPGIRIE